MDEVQYEEKKTPKGFLIKVRLDKFTYVVFKDSGPEVPRGAKDGAIIVNVPFVVFIGESFDLSHFDLNGLNYVNVKSGKMVIPYTHGDSREIKSIFLNSGSDCDILPVVVYYFRTVQDMINLAEKERIRFHHLIIDEDFPRAEMVKLKIRYPLLNILIIKKKVVVRKQVEEEDRASEAAGKDPDKMRATDAIREGSLNMYSGNPVFLARLHLRNMDLDKVKQLLLDFDLSTDDVIFIRTFLDVMIKNENKKVELERNRKRLVGLDKSFDLAAMVLAGENEKFENELNSGMDKELAFMMYALLQKEQDKASDIKKQLLFWEWKLRAKKQSVSKK